MTVESIGDTHEYGQTPGSLREYKTPAQLLAESHAARRAFADFMWRYVGHEEPRERAKGSFPPIEREAADGTLVHFTEQVYSGFSDLDASLVHVRLAPAQEEPLERFFVVTGSLETEAEAEERVVTHVENKWDVKSGLETKLYLSDPHYDLWPKKYRPQVTMSQTGFRYYAGGQNHDEQLKRIEYLHPAALGRFAVVHGG